MAKRCAICGAALNEGPCTRCRWVDPESIPRTETVRCPLCGSPVHYGGCTRCAWRESAT